MSPRAASRLEALGFEQVYDHVAGNAEWAAFGLPLEGDHHTGTRLGAHARSDVPACAPDDHMTAVREPAGSDDPRSRATTASRSRRR